ncbi:MAG: flagellar hook capping protein [Anaerolineae bacterium]|nr:flagellar hook capping protein [Phycisphaerae bacterium]
MTTAQAPSTVPGATNQMPKKSFALKTEDFIKMMITQLQNQDPMEPAKNQELLAQMSQIGQLQSQTTLTDSLKSMVLQNNLGAAGNLIGKSVQGTGDRGEEVTGLVNSVRVQEGSVFLELDSGKSLELTKVMNIATGPTGAPTTPAVSK